MNQEAAAEIWVEDQDDELVLSELDDTELVEQMHDDLYDGLKEEIVEGTQLLLGRGWAADKVLNEALVGGMQIVGIDFRDGILFVPEVLLAANAMKGGMTVLRPLLAETGAKPIGKMVIGTVKGDIHDIGKNLVGMMMEGAGFEVINLGINNSVDELFCRDGTTSTGYSRHVSPAHHHYAVHESRDRRDGLTKHSQRLYRHGWRRPSERGIRYGGWRRCVLPGCGGSFRHRHAPGTNAGNHQRLIRRSSRRA